MRVLHVIPSVARSAGGPSEVVRELLPELAECGVDVRLVTTDKGATPGDRDVLDQDYVVSSKNLIARWTFSPALVPALWNEVGNADLVHVHSVHTFPTTVALIMARMRRIPVVLQPHGALNRYHIGARRTLKLVYLRVVDGFGLRAVRAAIYSSKVELTHARESLPGVRGLTLPLGIEAALLSQPRDESSPPQVIFLARLAKKKRVDLFIQAISMPELSTVPFRAVIAGPIDPDLGFDPSAMVNSAGVSSRVDIMGQVGAEDRMRLLSRSAIYVLPSDDESFGMSVAEAMGSGCAVITSQHVGVAIDARSADSVVVVPQEPRAIAAAIARLLRDVPLRTELGQRGRTYARNNLTWPQIAEQLAGYYREAVSEATA